MKTENRFAKILANPVNVIVVLAGEFDFERACQLQGPPHPNFELVQMAEVRLDKLPTRYVDVAMIERLSRIMPLIITVRDRSEGGGQKKWTIVKCRNLYMKFLPYATFLDIGANVAHLFEDVIAEAKRLGVGIIISAHDFKKTPNNEELFRLGNICYKVGGDVLKIATKVRDQRDGLELNHAAFRLRNAYEFKVSTMAMDEPFGEILRYLDVLCGGPFIYGYLSEASVRGQPPALQVHRIFEKLGVTFKTFKPR